MDIAVTKITTTYPESQSPNTGSQSGKTGPSKFDKVQSQSKDSSNGDVASSGEVRTTSGSSANRISTQGGTAGAPDRIRQHLAASQHHLVQLRERVDATPGAGSNLQSRLSSIEHQYTWLDSVAKTMPSNASPQQWLALQQQVYAMNENIGVLSKMVGQAVGGVKSVLQTQV